MGNFYGFFIPKSILEELSFTPSDDYQLMVEAGQVIIAKEGGLQGIEPIDFADEELDAWSSILDEPSSGEGEA
tara:strand:+ start:13540 stop:13758 length:219 start_codon:yes stop_codon:yes gene_type:complete